VKFFRSWDILRDGFFGTAPKVPWFSSFPK